MTAPIPLDTPASWSLSQNLHFQRVFRSVSEAQHLILPASLGPVSPAQWREISDQVARLAAEAWLGPLPDLNLEQRSPAPVQHWGGVERRSR